MQQLRSIFPEHRRALQCSFVRREKVGRPKLDDRRVVPRRAAPLVTRRGLEKREGAFDLRGHVVGDAVGPYPDNPSGRRPERHPDPIRFHGTGAPRPAASPMPSTASSGLTPRSTTPNPAPTTSTCAPAPDRAHHFAPSARARSSASWMISSALSRLASTPSAKHVSTSSIPSHCSAAVRYVVRQSRVSRGSPACT